MVASCGLLACSRQEKIDYGTDTRSFRADVFPLVRDNCMRCHGATGGRGGVLLNDYAAVYANRFAVRSVVSRVAKHLGVSLSLPDKSAICCWIDNGALDN
jgi:hypothetical protein